MSPKMAKNDPTLAPSSGHVFQLIEPVYGALTSSVASEPRSETALRQTFWESQEAFPQFSPVETRFR